MAGSVPADIEVGLIGDSSLMVTNGAKKRRKSHFVDQHESLKGKIKLTPYCGGGVKNFIQHLKNSGNYGTLGISYFGNEHPKVAMRSNAQRLRNHQRMWDELFQLLRTKVHRTVFFMGGYADKFSTCTPVYDDNMGMIREWIQQAGFKLETHFEEVAVMSLGDSEHFAISELAKLANMWHHMLFGGEWEDEVAATAMAAASSSEAWPPLPLKALPLPPWEDAGIACKPSEETVAEFQETMCNTMDSGETAPHRRWNRPHQQGRRRWQSKTPAAEDDDEKTPSAENDDKKPSSHSAWKTRWAKNDGKQPSTSQSEWKTQLAENDDKKPSSHSAWKTRWAKNDGKQPATSQSEWKASWAENDWKKPSTSQSEWKAAWADNDGKKPSTSQSEWKAAWADNDGKKPSTSQSEWKAAWADNDGKKPSTSQSEWKAPWAENDGKQPSTSQSEWKASWAENDGKKPSTSQSEWKAPWAENDWKKPSTSQSEWKAPWAENDGNQPSTSQSEWKASWAEHDGKKPSTSQSEWKAPWAENDWDVPSSQSDWKATWACNNWQRWGGW